MSLVPPLVFSEEERVGDRPHVAPTVYSSLRTRPRDTARLMVGEAVGARGASWGGP
jgi:hypothetical protein